MVSWKAFRFRISSPFKDDVVDSAFTETFRDVPCDIGANGVQVDESPSVLLGGVRCYCRGDCPGGARRNNGEKEVYLAHEATHIPQVLHARLRGAFPTRSAAAAERGEHLEALPSQDFAEGSSHLPRVEDPEGGRRRCIAHSLSCLIRHVN